MWPKYLRLSLAVILHEDGGEEAYGCSARNTETSLEAGRKKNEKMKRENQV